MGAVAGVETGFGMSAPDFSVRLINNTSHHECP
jgi:hypothetical protein